MAKKNNRCTQLARLGFAPEVVAAIHKLSLEKVVDLMRGDHISVAWPYTEGQDLARDVRLLREYACWFVNNKHCDSNPPSLIQAIHLEMDVAALQQRVRGAEETLGYLCRSGPNDPLDMLIASLERSLGKDPLIYFDGHYYHAHTMWHRVLKVAANAQTPLSFHEVFGQICEAQRQHIRLYSTRELDVEKYLLPILQKCLKEEPLYLTVLMKLLGFGNKAYSPQEVASDLSMSEHDVKGIFDHAVIYLRPEYEIIRRYWPFAGETMYHGAAVVTEGYDIAYALQHLPESDISESFPPVGGKSLSPSALALLSCNRISNLDILLDTKDLDFFDGIHAMCGVGMATVEEVRQYRLHMLEEIKKTAAVPA